MYLRQTQKQGKEVSMEESIGTDKEGNNMSLAEVLIADDKDIHEVVLAKLNSKLLYNAMKKVLSKEEQQIIVWRYGLGNTKRRTQQEIADFYDISRSYVSRIEKKCLKKLFNELKNSFKCQNEYC